MHLKLISPFNRPTSELDVPSSLSLFVGQEYSLDIKLKFVPAASESVSVFFASSDESAVLISSADTLDFSSASAFDEQSITLQAIAAGDSPTVLTATLTTSTGTTRSFTVTSISTLPLFSVSIEGSSTLVTGGSGVRVVVQPEQDLPTDFVTDVQLHVPDYDVFPGSGMITFAKGALSGTPQVVDLMLEPSTVPTREATIQLQVTSGSPSIGSITLQTSTIVTVSPPSDILNFYATMAGAELPYWMDQSGAGSLSLLAGEKSSFVVSLGSSISLAGSDVVSVSFAANANSASSQPLVSSVSIEFDSDSLLPVDLETSSSASGTGLLTVTVSLPDSTVLSWPLTTVSVTRALTVSMPTTSVLSVGGAAVTATLTLARGYDDDVTVTLSTESGYVFKNTPTVTFGVGERRKTVQVELTSQTLDASGTLVLDALLSSPLSELDGRIVHNVYGRSVLPSDVDVEQ